MPNRTFVDAGGKRWEVFEVKRSGSGSKTVRPGLESGWLSFVSGETKRRLGQFPPDWESLPDAALSHLCRGALEVKYRDVSDVASDESLRDLLRGHQDR